MSRLSERAFLPSILSVSFQYPLSIFWQLDEGTSFGVYMYPEKLPAAERVGGKQRARNSVPMYCNVFRCSMPLCKATYTCIYAAKRPHHHLSVLHEYGTHSLICGCPSRRINEAVLVLR